MAQLRPATSASTRRARSISSPRSTWRSSGCSARSSRERFPDHHDPRRGDGRRRRGAGRPVLGVRSDRRHDQLRARPADLLRVARARNRRRRRGRRRLRSEPPGAVHRRARRRRVSERRADCACRRPATLVDAMLVTGFPYDVHAAASTRSSACSPRSSAQARAVRRLGSAAIDLCYVAAGRMDGFWESDLKPWDIAGGALIVAEAGGRVTEHGRRAVHVARRARAGHQRPPPRRDARGDSKRRSIPATYLIRTAGRGRADYGK